MYSGIIRNATNPRTAPTFPPRLDIAPPHIPVRVANAVVQSRLFIVPICVSVMLDIVADLEHIRLLLLPCMACDLLASTDLLSLSLHDDRIRVLVGIRLLECTYSRLLSMTLCEGILAPLLLWCIVQLDAMRTDS